MHHYLDDMVIDYQINTLVAYARDLITFFEFILTFPFKLVQFRNVEYIFVTPLGIVGACFKLVQLKNVPYIFVALFGIVGACTKLVQRQNVPHIFVTLFGIVGTCTKLVQSSNV